MTVLANLNSPNSIILKLKTLTPIHTGGIGQYGEQLHPSGLLGSIRSFSCLLAAAIGNEQFETEVWGTTTQENHKNVHAKRIALSWDVSRLETQKLPDQISWKDDNYQHRGWYFNVAQKGELTLTLTKRGISDVNWQLLLLALRIQILHASFGAKDQFGLGVVKVDKLPDVKPLNQEQVGQTLIDIPNLQNAFFAEIRFSNSAPSSFRECLETGLRYRAHLRGSFRKSGETNLRHYLFGDLRDKWGSAINVSAVYPLNEKESALRIWGVLPHTTSRKVELNRNVILNRIKTALDTSPQKSSSINWQICSTKNFATWINQLNLFSKSTTVQRKKIIKGRIKQ
jgi:hypothetical protein